MCVCGQGIGGEGMWWLCFNLIFRSEKQIAHLSQMSEMLV